MLGQPPGRLGPWLLLALAAVVCRAAAADDYSLSLKPLWEGYVKPGVPSELAVRLLAARGEEARLTLQSSRATVLRDVVFDAGIPLQVHLPLIHDTVAPVTVELAIGGQTLRRESRELHVLPAATPVVAVVDSGGWPAELTPPADARVLYVAATELPHSGQAYRLLSTLFMAESALRAMSGAQREALAEYVAGCGLLYLNGGASPEAQALRAVAGCDAGRLIFPAPDGTGFPRAGTADQLPTDAMLSPLLPQGHDTVLRSLIVFTLGYVIVLLLGARSARSASALLILPPAATTLAVLAWSLATPRIQVVSLAEMDSGDPMSRFAGLLQVTGTAPREITLRLPAQLGLPLSRQSAAPTTIQLAPAAQDFDLRLDMRLMSRHAFRVEGITPGSALAVRSTADRVRVTNRGDSPSAAAILAWNGRRYSVPALAAGQQWSQPDEAESWGHTAQEQLLRQRATDGGSWLLLPYEIPVLESLTGASDLAGWLLVRGRGDA